MGYSTQERSFLKILHLYSDWKWTGPAEPVLQMCKALAQRGHDVRIAYRNPPVQTSNKTIAQRVAEMGIAGITNFSLDRYMNPLNTLKDLILLPLYLKKERFDILHMHLSHDHAIGTICALPLRKKRPVLVRTFHKRSVLKNTLPNRLLLSHTDAYLFFTEGFRKRYIEEFQLDPDSTSVQPMSVDLKKFDPHKKYKDMRKEFGIPRDAIVIGTVGRFQKYRRMDWFLRAAKEIIKRHENVYFLIIGRSSHIKETVIDPIKSLGIEKKAILAGYRREDYVDTLSCLSIFTLLMPGSDGTARALREAMAMGKACVVSDYGMLPEIVDTEKAGIVVKDVPSLVEAWDELIKDPVKRKELGNRARKYAVNMFDLKRTAQFLENFYLKMLEKMR